MKRISIAATMLLIASMIPFANSAGQEKKTEKKVKVVIADASGDKVLIDTVFTGDAVSDSIVMKDGKVVILHSRGDKLTGSHDGKGTVHVFTSAGDEKEGSSSKSFSWVSADDPSKDKKIIVVDEDITVPPGTGKVFISSTRKKEDSENTRYVISRDGIKVTVEGSDYAKVKKIVDEIESTLDSDKQAVQKKNAKAPSGK